MDIIPYNQKLKDRARDLRKYSTHAEIFLWNHIKSRQILGYKFLRQRPIGNYIVDFFCKELMLAIEIDGSVHGNQKAEDDFRQGELETLGITFIRFTDGEIRKDLVEVLEELKKVIQTLLASHFSIDPT